jgi:hypothetical protein
MWLKELLNSLRRRGMGDFLPLDSTFAFLELDYYCYFLLAGDGFLIEWI